MIRSLYRNLCVAGCLTVAASLAVATSAAQTPDKTAGNADAPKAAAVAKAAPVGSADRGKELAYTCKGCHGITGYRNVYPTYHVPKITGQAPEYLVSALTEYKKGARKHPTMQAQAQSFSDQDIADIAAYLSSQKK